MRSVSFPFCHRASCHPVVGVSQAHASALDDKRISFDRLIAQMPMGYCATSFAEGPVVGSGLDARDTWQFLGQIVSIAFAVVRRMEQASMSRQSANEFSTVEVVNVKRFGTSHAPYRVEWLTDNGSCLAAKDTVEFAAWQGLISRFTPVRSPESNGMAEAFLKPLIRNYPSMTPGRADRPQSTGGLVRGL